MPTTTLDGDLADFLDDLGWKPVTLRNARSVLSGWQRWLAERDRAVLAASRGDLRAYLRDLEAAELAPETRRKRWQVIRRFYTWAGKPHRDGGGGLLEHDPMEGVDGPYVPKHSNTRVASPADVEAVIDHFLAQARRARQHHDGLFERSLRNAAMVSLMAGSGLRVGELGWLDLDDLRRNAASDIVGVHIGGRWGARSKSREERLTWVPPATAKLIERYLRRRGHGAGPLFLARHALTHSPEDRVNSTSVQMVVKRAAKALGIAMSPHDLRRCWATEAKRRGVDDMTLMMQAGWTRTDMIGRYTHADAQEIALARMADAMAGTPAATLRVVS